LTLLDLEKLKSAAQSVGCHLDERQLHLFDVYAVELLRWNERVNLTAVTSLPEIVRLHFMDSLTVASELPSMERSRSLLDIGTGAGFPGLPLRIAYPHLRVSLLEATGKKTDFLRHLLVTLGLDDVVVLQGRAEQLAHKEPLRESFDVTTARAVAPLSILVELALPFTIVNGRFIAMKKGDIHGEVAAAGPAIATLGGGNTMVQPVDVEQLTDNRFLVTVHKLKPTPLKYPRRPGMPAKRPL